VPMEQRWTMISTVLKSCAMNGFSKKDAAEFAHLR
jgi:hypothetical protein